jgi:hypothetical protein
MDIDDLSRTVGRLLRMPFDGIDVEDNPGQAGFT